MQPAWYRQKGGIQRLKGGSLQPQALVSRQWASTASKARRPLGKFVAPACAKLSPSPCQVSSDVSLRVFQVCRSSSAGNSHTSGQLPRRRGSPPVSLSSSQMMMPSTCCFAQPPPFAPSPPNPTPPFPLLHARLPQHDVALQRPSLPHTPQQSCSSDRRRLHRLVG